MSSPSAGSTSIPREVERILVNTPAVAAVAVVEWSTRGSVRCLPPSLCSGPPRRCPLRPCWRGARGRIANFKTPRHAAVVADLPRNASMKVLKSRLRARAAELFAPKA